MSALPTHVSDLNKHAQQMDAQDKLKHKRDEFILPEGMIYLDGNSLGPVTHQAKRRAEEVVEQQWQPDLIKSWNQHAWIDLPAHVGASIAPIIGAQANSVIACDSISVNLHKLLSVAMHLQREQPQRNKMLTQQGNFPTDGYIAQGFIAQHSNLSLHFVDESQIIEQLDEHVAVLLLTHVNYKTGRVLDMQAITAAAHRHGIITIWDLAHSAGALPLHCADWQVDFAVGCGYKYLNGGPGAPAFIYAAPRHHHQLRHSLTGWMGHAQPFAFDRGYMPADGVSGFLCGTPPVLSMSVLAASLAVFSDVDMQVLRSKSLALSDFFLACMQAHSLPSILPCISPLEHPFRGSQLAFTHAQAYAICQALIARGVVADFRAPDVLRVGFAPLYLQFQDIIRSVELVAEVMQTRAFEAPEYQTVLAVT